MLGNMEEAWRKAEATCVGTHVVAALAATSHAMSAIHFVC